MENRELLRKVEELERELREKEGEEAGSDDFIRDFYIPKVDKDFYDPGWNRLRHLIWPFRSH